MANILTISRIVLALSLLCLPARSVPFAVLYVATGLTDIADGWVARKTDTVGETGARLDTTADLVFVLVCLCKLLPIAALPSYLLIWTAAIAGIKLINIISGFVVQKRLVAVHSALNKLTGLLLFFLPLTLPFLDIAYSGGVVCAVATLAAIREGHQIRTGTGARSVSAKN